MEVEEKEGDIEINDIMKIDNKVRLFVLALNEAHIQGLENCMDIFEKIFGEVDDEYEPTINEIWINRKNPYNISDTIKNIFFYKIFDNLKEKATNLLHEIVNSDDRVIKKVSLDTQVLERILQAKLYVDTYKSLENMGIKIDIDDINKNYSIKIQKNYNNINIDEKYINLRHAIQFIRLLEDIKSKFDSNQLYTTQFENESDSNSISINQIDFSDPFEMIYQIIRKVFYLERQITKFQLYIMNYYRKNKKNMRKLFFSYDLDKFDLYKFNFMELLKSIIQFINEIIIEMYKTEFQLTIDDRDKYQYIKKDIVLLKKIIENIENDTDANELLKNIDELSVKLIKFDLEIVIKLKQYDQTLRNIKKNQVNEDIKSFLNNIKEGDTFLSEYEKFNFLKKSIKVIKSGMSDSESKMSDSESKMSDSESNDDFKQWLDKFIQNNDIIEETEEERILNDLKMNLHTLYRGDTLSEDVVKNYVNDLKQSKQSSLLQNDDSYSKKYDEILDKLSKGKLMDKLLQSSSFNNPIYTSHSNP